MSRGHALEFNSTSLSKKSRLSHLLVFLFGVIAGVGLLGMRWVVLGNADPFNVSWPLYLQLGSWLLTILVGSLSRRPFTVGFGLFFGLVMYMLIECSTEYPVASIIALTIHGLLPAQTGALCLVLFSRIAAVARKRDQN